MFSEVVSVGYLEKMSWAQLKIVGDTWMERNVVEVSSRQLQRSSVNQTWLFYHFVERTDHLAQPNGDRNGQRYQPLTDRCCGSRTDIIGRAFSKVYSNIITALAICSECRDIGNNVSTTKSNFFIIMHNSDIAFLGHTVLDTIFVTLIMITFVQKYHTVPVLHYI